MLADVFITTKGRPELFRRSLESFLSATPESVYRLTIVDDGDFPGTQDVIQDHEARIDYVLRNTDNRGLGPSINMALAHIDALKRWDEDPPPLTVYCQDDCTYSPGWLEKLSLKYMQLKGPLKLGFATGHNAIEHPVKQDLGNGMMTKDWIRASSMMATHEYWMSMWPISRIDPETGRERGKPNDGMGSSVDWWFIRNHENSVCRTGRTNLVIPGLVQHIGYRDSTWLKRELPESESDKKVIG
jgi:glycosyltransferase involved in cell wall biosynthesis